MWPFSSNRRRSGPPPTDLIGLVEEAKSAAAGIQNDWDILNDFYDSDWQQEQMQALLAENEAQLEKFIKDVVVINTVYPLVEGYTANLMQAVGTWYVVSQDAQYDQYARDVTRWLQALYDELAIPEQLEKAYRDAILLGNGVLKVYWNDGTRQAHVEAISPYDYYPDPAVSDPKRCDYVAIRNTYSKAEAKRMLPGFDEAKAATVQLERRNDLRSWSSSKRGYEVWECYWESGSRYTVYSGSQVYFDRKSPVPNNRFPVHALQMHVQTGHFWSPSMVSYVLPAQSAENFTYTRMAMHQHLAAVPVFFTDDPQLKDVVIEPAAVIAGHFPGAKAGWMPPPEFPASAAMFLDRMDAAIDTLSGMHEVTRGLRPQGVTSGVTVDSLRQTALVRLLSPIRTFAYRLGDIGQQILELHQEYSNEPLTAARPTADGVELNRIGPEHLSRLEGMKEEGGEWSWSGKIIPHPYRVVVQAPSELPLSQPAIADLALRLAQMSGPQQYVDAQGVLEATNFPYRDQIVARLEAIAQANAQGQQAALEAQQQGQPGQPGPQDMGQPMGPQDMMELAPPA